MSAQKEHCHLCKRPFTIFVKFYGDHYSNIFFVCTNPHCTVSVPLVHGREVRLPIDGSFRWVQKGVGLL